MLELGEVEFYSGSREELLPGFTADFPHIVGRCRFGEQKRRSTSWHWHKAVELFYVTEGVLEYNTPNGKWMFPAGSGGMVNSNVLHMTRLPEVAKHNVHLLHIFDASFIGGAQGGRIEQKYVLPLVTSRNLELAALYPDHSAHREILNRMAESFRLSEDGPGYEIKLREVLSDIWFQIFSISQPVIEARQGSDRRNDKIKSMMAYVHEHYAEKIQVSELAAAAFTSERECFRLFRECLHMTPVEYITGYRLQMARHMLANSSETVTYISQACCLGSSSYFGKLLRRDTGCGPLEYRRKWQDNDI